MLAVRRYPENRLAMIGTLLALGGKDSCTNGEKRSVTLARTKGCSHLCMLVFLIWFILIKYLY